MLCEKANWIISKIKKEFGDDLQGEPFRFGSTEEGTALKEKYDIDISVSFKHDAFATIFDMYEILGDFLMNLEGKYDVLRVRKQTVSIGVFFDLGYGREGKLDIVPIKITNRKGNKTSGYLHKNSSDFFPIHSYQKTDPIILSKEKLSKTQKEILIALKKWKKNKNVPISSHLLQNFIQDAYYCNSNRIPHGLTKR
ncbi:nucleotidyltransferase domain-containing protein [Paraflavitalea speifideaquila]|uniref:nucleotidyltransferase domain-containing protein n=1 Tax=Paraflavitalea speifideaquila TaxID=3076558 RepID=UPI0028EBF738|nr:nucleotidyltransferase domain-containing protein [Paraflavitalea speifideiaquila]